MSFPDNVEGASPKAAILRSMPTADCSEKGWFFGLPVAMPNLLRGNRPDARKRSRLETPGDETGDFSGSAQAIPLAIRKRFYFEAISLALEQDLACAICHEVICLAFRHPNAGNQVEHDSRGQWPSGNLFRFSMPVVGLFATSPSVSVAIVGNGQFVRAVFTVPR